MLVPWVFFFFVKTLRSQRLPIGLGVSLALLWLGHSTLGYYTGLILAIVFVLLAARHLVPWSVLRPQTAWRSVLAFAVLVGPYLTVMTILARQYDLSRMLAPPYQPRYQFRPASAYLWDQHWHFGVTAAGLTVQLDHAMLLLLLIGLGRLALRPPAGAGSAWRVSQPAVPFLMVFAIGAVLQLDVSAPFYRLVPGARFIQFPWRLLALMTPALIVAAVYLADKTLPPDARNFVLGGAAAWMVVGCGAFAPLRDPRIPLEPRLAGLTFSGFREYEPREAAPVGEIEAKISARWHESGCAYSNAAAVEEVRSVVFHTSCGRAAVLPLPLYASPLHLVRTSRSRSNQSCLPLPDFPSVCGAVISAADDTISVTLPNVVSFASWAWRRGIHPSM